MTHGDLQITRRPDPGAWDDYVATGGRPLYHRREWDGAFAAYGLETIRLAALRDGRIEGVLPLVHQRSRLFGSRLVSLPWFDSAGVISADESVTAALLGAASDLAERAGAREIHLRQLAPVPGWTSPRTDKVLMRLELPEDAATLWDAFPGKVRNQVRKAEKAGLSWEIGGAASLADFHAVYATNMRDLGSPPHGEPFFREILEGFGDDARLHLVRLEGDVIGGGLTLDNGGSLEIPWASSLREHNRLCVNHMMYWNILREACGRYRRFHFGRSTVDSGTYRFKKQWGAEPVTLHWYRFDGRGRSVEDHTRPEEEFGLARRLWTKLPVGVSRALGPRIIRHVA